MQGWDRKYLQKEEDNLAREQTDQASRECSDQAGVGGRDFGDFWYQKQQFLCILESNFRLKNI